MEMARDEDAGPSRTGIGPFQRGRRRERCSEAEHQHVAADKIGDETLVAPRRALEVVATNFERIPCCSFGHSRQVLGGERAVGRASQARALSRLRSSCAAFGRMPGPDRTRCSRAPGARSTAPWRPARAIGDRRSTLSVSALPRRVHGRSTRRRPSPSLWGRCDRLGSVSARARGAAEPTGSGPGGRNGPSRGQ
jgi:hypothetical protein